MFNVRFVMYDSSVESYLVQAETEYQAINAVLNRLKPTSDPKFVIVETPHIIATDNDCELIRSLNKIELNDGVEVYELQSKTAEVININGVTIHKGSLVDILDFDNWD